MIGRLSHRMTALLVAALIGVFGCDGAPDGAAAAVTEAGYFTGRVTNPEGSPITVPGVEYNIGINGITAVGESNAFPATVGRDGTFKVKLAQSHFYPPLGKITFPFEGKKYIIDLVPVEPFSGTRDGKDGIS